MRPGFQQEQINLERHEAKYIVPAAQLPEIREFIQPFCVPDPNAKGDIPEYTLTTLQLDSPDMTLYRAWRDNSVNRFKLRIRGYEGGDEGGSVFVEVKRKIKGVVVKTRCMIPRSFVCGELFDSAKRATTPPFRSHKERVNFSEFSRLVEILGARPVVLIRYIRESYLGANDLYARVTFDRKLTYSLTRNWDLQPENVRWRPMDSTLALDRPVSGHVLELKTYRDTPRWMVDMTERFSLVRSGFCKYATALRLESLYKGSTHPDEWESCTYNTVGI